MLRRLNILPAVFTMGLASAAAASPSPEPRHHDAAPAVRPAEKGIQLAQSRDAEVYYDEDGNRVIVDAATGEVIAIQPRRFNPPWGMRRPAREIPRQDRYYLDDPEDMARLRRDEMREGRGALLPPPDDYRYQRDHGGRDYGEPAYPGEDDSARDYRRDEFPEAPRVPGADWSAPAETPPPDQVERAPLGEQDAAASEPETTGTVTQPGEAAVTDPAAPPALNFTAREDVAAIQVLMDRAGASPGVIDGKFGSNVDKALEAYSELTGQRLRSTDTAAIREALAASGGDAIGIYEITPADAAGPFVASVPADYSEKAMLDQISFTSVTEMLAERFHMDETYLKALNPDANFARPGTRVRVANFGSNVTAKVQRIIADKGRKQVRAYDAAGKLVAAYPATIGSADTPSPTGTHAVSRVAVNPNYTYNPKINFKQGENDKVLTIPPGPNGPVGTVWIALDKPTYGIHGTPDPSKIGKSESHGCVRLTNWDAQELAKLVSAGVTVEFVE